MAVREIKMDTYLDENAPSSNNQTFHPETTPAAPILLLWYDSKMKAVLALVLDFSGCKLIYIGHPFRELYQGIPICSIYKQGHLFC